MGGSTLRILQVGSVAAGVALAAWAVFAPRFRDAEGIATGVVCLPIAIAIAIGVWATFLGSSWRRFAGWVALAIAGEAVALQMIEAGPVIRYQHYLSPVELVQSWHVWLIAAAGLQAVAVAAGLARMWPSIVTWTGQHLRWWQCAGVIGVVSLAGAELARDVPRYAIELAIATVIQIINMGNLALIAGSIPGSGLASIGRRFESLFGPADDLLTPEPGAPDRFSLVTAALGVLLATMLAAFSYERHPHVPDEVVYIYPARYFAQGLLSMPEPPVREAFSLALMDYHAGHWFSAAPPGWPAMLAIGALVGLTWLVDPVLNGVNILLMYLLVREIASRRFARLAIVLLSVSPWNTFLAMSFMTHTSTLTCALAAALALARARRSGRPLWAWLSGAALGLTSVIRPLEGLIAAVVLGAWALGSLRRRAAVAAMVGLAGGGMLVGAMVLPYNRALTGDPLLFPIMAYNDKNFGKNSNALGFGPDRGGAMHWALDPFPGHGPLDATINTALNVAAINTELFGWAAGSLFFVAVSAFVGRLRRFDVAMLGVLGSIVGLHVFYWFSGGPDFGARYWFLAIVPSVLLTVRGIQALEQSREARLESILGGRATVAALVLCVVALVTFVPWRAVDKYHHYRGMRPDVRRLAREHRFGRSLVLVRGNRHPDYASAATYNPIDLHAAEPVYAWDQNPQVRRLILEAYPDRPVWILEGPTLTRAGYRVVAGPLDARHLLEE